MSHNVEIVDYCDVIYL